jgi:hypothetical protein
MSVRRPAIGVVINVPTLCAASSRPALRGDWHRTVCRYNGTTSERQKKTIPSRNVVVAAAPTVRPTNKRMSIKGCCWYWACRTNRTNSAAAISMPAAVP